MSIEGWGASVKCRNEGKKVGEHKEKTPGFRFRTVTEMYKRVHSLKQVLFFN